MRTVRPSFIAFAALVLGTACQRTSTTSATEEAVVVAPAQASGSELGPSTSERVVAPEVRPSEPAERDEPREAAATPSDFAASILAAHNHARGSVRPAPTTPIPPLEWDAGLAAIAQRWADSCPAGHRPDNDYGENIFWSGGHPSTPESVVQSWTDESRNYDYATTLCSRGGRASWAFCGHYTQVVWRDTRRLGCGIRTDCPGDFDTVVVCNYDPPGNMNATERRIPRPY